MNKRWAPHNTGFTIVELLVVIVVIGILAAVVIVAYNGVQRSAITATVQSDLANATKQFGLAYAETGAYPGVMPSSVVSSPGVTLNLIYSHATYSGLSSVQSGVLFQTVCQALVSQGYGTGTNLGGGVEQYVTGCNVYGNSAIQINGWYAHDFSIPITINSVYEWYNSNVTADAWRPNVKTDMLAFATALASQYAAYGGTFPVTSFWDPWATSTNGGVLTQSLPTESSSSSYCIAGSHIKYTDISLHVTENGEVESGGC